MTQRTETDWWVSQLGTKGREKLAKGVKGTDFQLKINKPQGRDTQRGEYREQYCTVYLRVAKRVNLKSAHRKKKLCECVW